MLSLFSPSRYDLVMTTIANVIIAVAAAVGAGACRAPLRPAASVPLRASATAPEAGYSGLGAASVSEAEILAFAPPPSPAAIAAPVAALLDVAGVEGGAVTSDGRRMFFSWRISGSAQIWRQDGPGTFPLQLTGGRQPTTIAQLSPDDSYLVVSRDLDGQENPGLYLLAADGGPLTALYHKPGVQAFHCFISDDARYVYFRTNERRADAFEIYRYDRQTSTTSLVLGEPGLWSVQDYRDERVLLAKDLGNTRNEIWELELRTGRLTPRLGQGEASQWVAKYGAAEDELVVLTDDGDDRERVWSYRLGRTRTLLSGPTHYEVASFSIDRPRRRIYIVANEAGAYRLVLLDARSYQALPLPALPPHDNIWGGGTTPNGRFASFSFDSARMPAATLVHDWQTGKTVAWRVPSLPEVDPASFVAPTVESYPARDGTPIPMVVYRPARCAAASHEPPCPVLVNFHGGPEGQARLGFSSQAQIFTRAGFILVQPNVRGSTGYGKAWLDADNGPRRLEVITDIEDAARFIRTTWQRGQIAPKIGVFGSSYGGYSTLMAMTYFAGAYDAGVSSVGISNLRTFLENTAPYRRALRISEYGDPTRDAAALAALSPMTHVAKLRAPLLIIAGVHDPRVPVGEALQFYEAARTTGSQVSMMLFPDEGHGMAKRDNQVLSLSHIVAFFSTHLK